ncbi:UPF0280 family protein [Caenispirillum bisanense]|uniref:UPF0280 family protein n=1 Tax=Caenispirillum bisanense TaxID=414052 RepID=UPI0031CFD803
MQSASHRLLPDGRRLHLHHGPIDLIVEAQGPAAEVQAARTQAVARFQTVLTELVAELPLLRRAVAGGACPLTGPVARRMWAAVQPHRPAFVTPMAAVAGAVADEVLAALTAGRTLTRAYVNNGGDIALFLAPGAQAWRAGIVVDPADPRSPGALTVRPDMPVRGIATSGRLGRSLSLGIADSVTVLAGTAAEADAAATLIANAVDLPGHPAVARQPAREMQPDSDLGDRPVTTAVGPLAPEDVAAALTAGRHAAEAMRARGLIAAAVLVLDRQVRLVGAPDLLMAPPSPRRLSTPSQREDRIHA